VEGIWSEERLTDGWWRSWARAARRGCRQPA
jgi:hypothetical protein